MDIPTTSTTLLRDIAQDSHNERWGEFVSRYRPMMEAFLRDRFPAVEADDIIQETLLALCKILPDYQYSPDEKGHFHNYLTGILRNKATRALRKRKSDCEKLASYADGGRARSPSAPHLVAYPVLADLGLIKEISSPFAEHQTSNIKLQTLTLGGVGTPGYGAPEQMERGEATEASDIHALGVLADKCSGGKPPRAWKRIIERATSSLSERRYQSVATFARAIRRRNFPRIAVVSLVVAGFLGIVAACSFALRASVDEEALKWRAMCRSGEIVSVEERNEPVSPDRPYPAVVQEV